MAFKTPSLRYLRIGLLSVAGILIASLVYIIASIWYYSTLDEKRPADAIIILGAAAWYKRPSPVFEERIRHGLWLYQNGYAKTLIMTGGKSLNAPYSEAYVARRFALKKQVPESDILVEETSRNTWDNLVNAKSLMDKHNLKTAIIVSDPFHMKRALSIAEDVGIDAYSSPTPTSRCDSLQFLFQETGHMIGYILLPHSSS